MAHAAAIPKIVLSGTEIAATISVSRIEASASRSLTAAHHNSVALAQRFVQHCAKRQEQDHAHVKQTCDGSAGLRRRAVREGPSAHVSLRCCHCCSRLSSSGMAKEMSSITQAIAAAPA